MPTNSGIRFVMDGPAPTAPPKKKRARLVTACDACRIRKIKCIQTSVSQECEACRASSTRCAYGDRERYHAMRGLSAAQSSLMPSPWNASITPMPVNPPPRDMSTSSSDSTPTSPNSPPTKSEMVMMDVMPRAQPKSIKNSRQMQPPAPQQQVIQPGLSQSLTSNGSSFQSPTDFPIQTRMSRSDSLTQSQVHELLSKPDVGNLFSSQNSQYPRQDLMVHLAELFLDRLGIHLPFIKRETVMPLVTTGTLQPLLANGIAALACRFSDKPEFATETAGFAAGEPYLQMAKLLAVSMVSWPSIEVCHGLILIAWAEYGSSRDSGLFMFTRMAVAMLMDLGYKDPAVIENVESPAEKDVLKYTWWSVSRIDLASSWGTGRPPSLRDPQSPDDLPFSTKDLSGLTSRGIIFAYLTDLFAIRDDITNIMNEDKSTDAKAYNEIVSNIQRKITTFYRTLPPNLAFHAENFKKHNEENNGALLVLLHLSFHGSNMVVHWPSLFKEFAAPISHSVDIAYASSIAVVDVIRIAKHLDPVSLWTNPFMDTPVSITARVLMAAPGALGAAVKKNKLFDKSKNDQGLSSCVDVLSSMSRYWAPTAIAKALIEQHRVSSEPLASSPVDTVMQMDALPAANTSTAPAPAPVANTNPPTSVVSSVSPTTPSSPPSLSGSPFLNSLVNSSFFGAGASGSGTMNTTDPNQLSLFMSPYLSGADDKDIFAGYFETSMLNHDWDLWDTIPTTPDTSFQGLLKDGSDPRTGWLGLHPSSPTMQRNTWGGAFGTG